MVVVAAFAGDVKESFSRGSLVDLLKCVLEAGDVYEFLWADVQVQAEKSLELAAGDEGPSGQFAYCQPAFCLMDSRDQGEGLLGRGCEAVKEEAVQLPGQVGGSLSDKVGGSFVHSREEEAGIEFYGFIGSVP